jgi:4-amino-4-deoxy-L-arabinose transferase-like glycosyltransferase
MARVTMSLVGLAFLTRAPGVVLSRMFNVDESYLAAMGATMGRGGHLYVDAVDRKPPVLPWLYSIPQWLFGSEDLRPMRVLAACVIAAAGVVIALLVVRLGGDRRAGLAAGALMVLGSAAFLPADGQAANFEVFAVLPASAAVLGRC